MNVPPLSGISRRQLLQSGLTVGALSLLGGNLAGCASTGTTGGSNSLSMFGWDISDVTAGLGKGFQACKIAWEKKSGATLNFDGVPFGDFVVTGTTRARSGNFSDTIEMLPDLNHEGIFPALLPTKKVDYGDLSNQVEGWNSAIINLNNPDEFAGIPGGAQGTLWYYNKAIFAKAGLDPETPPKIWAEFEVACAAIKAIGKSPIGMSGIDGNLLWWGWLSFSPQFFTTTAEVLKVRAGDIKLNDPRFLKSLEPLASTYAKGWWNSDYASKKFADMEASFAAGEIGMTAGLITSAMNWQVWDAKMGKDAYGVFPSPLVDGGKKQGQFFNPVLLYGINAKSQNTKLARDWISFVVSKEGQEIMLRESGQFPNRSDVSIADIARSPGAERIKEIVAEVGGVPVAQNNFNSAALSAATQNITQAVVSGNLSGFLDNLALLQSS